MWVGGAWVKFFSVEKTTSFKVESKLIWTFDPNKLKLNCICAEVERGRHEKVSNPQQKVILLLKA